MMATEVSSLFRIMKSYNNEEGEAKGKRRDLITRDLLGDRTMIGSKELDLDLKVPSGFERRLDILSGEMFLKKHGSDPVNRQQLHDLNLPPLPEDSSASAFDLKLLFPSASSEYQSVCTLEKVKFALERAERESQSKRQQISDGSGCSSPSIKRQMEEDQDGSVGTDGSDGLMAAGCSSCMLYVLISKGNPRCPRCDSHVPVPVMQKKPRIDLNSLQN